MSTHEEDTAPAPFRRPPAPPTAADVADRDLWDEAVAGSLDSVQAAAEKWRTGLAAFVTLVTGGLLVKGPEATDDLATRSLVLLTLFGGGGLLLAILGLWQALHAAAGTPAVLRYEDVVAAHGSYKQFRAEAAKAASRALATARRLVGWSLFLLGITVIAWWWTPTEPSQLVKVSVGDEVVCGKLQSADAQKIVVKPGGASRMTTIPFDDVDNIHVVGEC